MRILPRMRGRDAQGCGYFGASRGGRAHNGIDFASCPGTPVAALSPGKVTKLGYPYADKLEFRYVEVTDPDGLRCRYFYVRPSVSVGQDVRVGDTLGTVQMLPYAGIEQHYHFEVMKGRGEYLDPIKYLCGDY